MLAHCDGELGSAVDAEESGRKMEEITRACSTSEELSEPNPRREEEEAEYGRPNAALSLSAFLRALGKMARDFK